MPPDTLETISVPSSQETQGFGRDGRLLGWLLAWGTKGSLALTDQALFAGAQFAVNILLARWLTTEAYGTFAIAYSIYLLASSVHSALLVEPMVVFGSGRYFQQRKSYLDIVLRGHTMLMVPTGLLLLVAGFVSSGWKSPLIGHALYALALALPLTLLSELARRAFYIDMRPGRAAVGGAIYFGSLIVTVFGLHAAGILTPATAILAMGGGALLTSSVQLAWLSSHWPSDFQNVAASTVAAEHWCYGRWVLAAVFPSWAQLNISYLILPLWFGLQASAGLKAMMNLATPSRQVLVALGGLLLPLMVRSKNQGGPERVIQTMKRVTMIFFAGAGAYLAFLWFFRAEILQLLYGGKYTEYGGLPVLLVGLVPLVTAWTVTLGSAISAYERTDLVFWSNVAASVVSLTIGIWMTAKAGVGGAIGAYLLSYATLASSLWFFFRKHRMSSQSDRITAETIGA